MPQGLWRENCYGVNLEKILLNFHPSDIYATDTEQRGNVCFQLLVVSLLQTVQGRITFVVALPPCNYFPIVGMEKTRMFGKKPRKTNVTRQRFVPYLNDSRFCNEVLKIANEISTKIVTLKHKFEILVVIPFWSKFR